MKRTIITSCLIGIFSIAKSQTMFSSVRTIFDSKCAQTCHNLSNLSGGLNLTGTDAEVRSAMVNITPQNAAAAQIGDKIIKPGYPERSFLLRKCATASWGGGYPLDLITEGTPMPQSYPADSLSSNELETIRQWIYYGAKATGNQVNQTTISNFYNGLGLPPLTKPAAPLLSEGFQIHLGPFLRDPGTEVEYFLRHELQLADSVEVNRIEVFMNSQSHHYIMYKFLPGQAASFPDGLRTTSQNSSNNATTMISGWQYNLDVRLPENTAYFWEKDAVLDLNYHLINSNSDSVLGAEVYMNIYTQPKNSGAVEMNCELVLYGGFNPYALTVPAGDTVVRSQSDYQAGSTDTLFVWKLTSHTHKYGVDYDLYLRNANGTRGEQIYEGFYDPSYSFMQSFYDWNHPAIRLFDPQLPIKANIGLIQEAKYFNYGPSTVGFGLTTNDEMMLYQIQYTLKSATGNVGIVDRELNHDLSISPNPSSGVFEILLSNNSESDIDLSVIDVSGKVVFKKNYKTIESNKIVIDEKLKTGLYLVSIGNQKFSQKGKIIIN